MPSARKPRRPPATSTALEMPDVIEVKAGVFKDTCLQLLDEVHRREVEVVVTKHGQAVARLVPADARVPTSRGFMRGTVVSCGDIVSPDFEPWGDLG